MAFNYVFWSTKVPRNVAHLDSLVGFEDDFEIADGISHAADIPDDVYFDMRQDFPDNTLLADQHSNTNAFVLVSQRLRDFLAERVPEGIELLPTHIHDHKGKQVPEPYYIVNPLGTYPLLDEPRCNIVERSERRIIKLERLAIHEDRIPANRPLLRIDQLARYVAIRRDLADAISSGQFTGLRWVEPVELENIRIPADLVSLRPRKS
ncbi:MAG: DUF1629 domain-containing protein [Polyangiales bacterium]